MVSRTTRGALAALVALAVSVSVSVSIPLSAEARTSSRPIASSDRQPVRHFSAREARGVLAKVRHAFAPKTTQGPTTLKTDATLLLRDLARARYSLTGAQRAEADSLLARPTNGSGDDPVKYGRATYRYKCIGTVFCIHWVTNGHNAISTVDRNHNGIPDYVDTVYATVSHVYSYEVGTLHYRRPLPDTATVGQRGNPNSRIDIYLAELGDQGLYGYCAPEGSTSKTKLPGYCVLDNNYSPSEFGSRNYLNPLRVTVAHEFFHDIQFGYDVDEDPWFMEGTATWMEDEVYDSVNDNLQYLPYSPIRYPGHPVDYTTDLARYGSWIFFKYASETLGRDVVRQFWNAADSGVGTAYSLQAIHSVVSARTDWTRWATTFGLWNTLLPGTYSERSLYPSPVFLKYRSLTPSYEHTSAATRLLHMARAVVKVRPASALPARAHLQVALRGPATTHGAAAMVVIQFKSDGHTKSYPLTLTPTNSGSSGVVTVPFFDTLSNVYVVMANTSADMSRCSSTDPILGGDGYPKYSCGGTGTYDGSSEPDYVTTTTVVP